MSEDLIKRSDAIEAIEVVDWFHQNGNKDMVSGANSAEHQAWYKAEDIYKALEAVPSADRPSAVDLSSVYSTAYKNGYEKGKADRPQGDFVSKRYLLAEIDDLADEFSEVDENGLHSERWCGILDSRGIIVNAPSVSQMDSL